MSRCEGNREENGSDEVMVVFGSIQGDGRKLNETGLAAELLFDIVRIRSADLLRLSIYRRNGENGLAFCPLRMMAYVVSGPVTSSRLMTVSGSPGVTVRYQMPLRSV